MLRGVILDLDGTCYRGDVEVPGAGRFVNTLLRYGIRPFFLTNRANRSPREICAQLRGYGIPCHEHDILTTAEATARHLKAGTYFLIGEAGLREELEKVGMSENTENPDYVIVSFDRRFDFEKLRLACRFISRGARFVATNADRALRLEKDIIPGTGAIVAAIEAACGVKPLVVGKPKPFIVEIALERLGMTSSEVLMVGDNVETDVPAGEEVHIRTVLILTGISTRDDVSRAAVKPHWIVQNFEELTRLIRALLGMEEDDRAAEKLNTGTEMRIT